MGEWSWELAILLSKFIAYLSFVSLTGGLFVLFLGSRRYPREHSATHAIIQWSAKARTPLVRLLILASGFGKLSVILFFLLQVGKVNQNGLAGMADGFMIGLLAQTPVGSSAAARLAGFVLIGLLLIVYRGKLTGASSPILPITLVLLWCVGILLCCAGFAVLGHVANLDWFEQALLGLHVLLIGMWIGALYPLFLLCRTEPASAIAPLMKRFGDYAWGITIGLVVAGTYLLTRLLGSVDELFTTPYGRLLALKVVLVLCLLGLAALNKFRLVPALQNAGAAPLQRSIRGEMALAFVILMVTAVLSTLTGPVEHMV